MTFIFDLFLFPFRTLHSFWGLLFISIISGIWMIFIFKAVSNQQKISGIRKKMGGQVLGILLHVSSPGTVFKFAGKLIISNFYYLWLILLPLLVISVPFMLTYTQLEARYATIPFADTAEPVTVTLHYSDNLPERNDILIRGENVAILDPIIRIDTLNEVSFNIRPDFNTNECLYKLEIGDVVFPIGRISSGNGAIISRGFQSNQLFANHLMRPWIVSPEIQGKEPSSAYYSLPHIRFSIFGWYWSWLAIFLVFSSLSAVVGAIVFKIKV